MKAQGMYVVIGDTLALLKATNEPRVTPLSTRILLDYFHEANGIQWVTFYVIEEIDDQNRAKISGEAYCMTLSQWGLITSFIRVVEVDECECTQTTE